ncbi:glycosyltransferase [Thermogymnomonas acidicola]|uniref:glycosyltransferase family A protein n=1 Tax=Thermogymnomonas acidicola TaxID=399579 RepID=UPI0009466346|nr:glycosyltransferase family 2 protein [Thermogymnomonas acidicola]
MDRATVLITAFERRGYLQEALDSVLKQTAKEFDILLVVSKYYSQEEFNDYKDHVKVVIDEQARNKCDLLFTGINQVNTDIVIFLDDDDFFSERKVETILKAFQEHPEVGFIHNDFVNVFERGPEKSARNIVRNSSRNSDRGISILTGSVAVATRNDLDMNLSSVSIKKDIASNYLQGLKSIEAADDTFFLYCALDSGNYVLGLPEKLTYYRRHASSVTGYIGHSFGDYLRHLREKLASDVGAHEAFSDCSIVNNSSRFRGYVFLITLLLEWHTSAFSHRGSVNLLL